MTVDVDLRCHPIVLLIGAAVIWYRPELALGFVLGWIVRRHVTSEIGKAKKKVKP